MAMICVINTLSIKMEKWAQKIKSTFVFTMQSSNYAGTLLVGLLPFFALFFVFDGGSVCTEVSLSCNMFLGLPNISSSSTTSNLVASNACKIVA